MRFSYLDFIHEAVFVLNDTREIVFGNTAAINRFGQHRVGQDIVQVIRNPGFLNLIGDALDGAKISENTIAFGQPINGLFDVRVAQFSDEDPQRTLLLVSLRDATEMQQAGEMRSDFVANVSHELRSPLSTISGFIETLKGPAKDDPPARERFLDLMEQEAERMVRLISDLLSLSKVEAHQRQRPTAQIDIVAIVQSVQTSLAKQAKDGGRTVNLDVAEEISEIPGNEDELIQVIQNLLENALKYSKPNSAVTIKLSKETDVPGMTGTVIKIEISDESEGIPKQHLSRLTERFYRVDSHRSRSDGGTGLGLAIVKHIVQHHRGRLKIESEVGLGSTFTVLLPSDQITTAIDPQTVTKL